jgi:hypothetical protein
MHIIIAVILKKPKGISCTKKELWEGGTFPVLRAIYASLMIRWREETYGINLYFSNILMMFTRNYRNDEYNHFFSVSSKEK